MPTFAASIFSCFRCSRRILLCALLALTATVGMAADWPLTVIPLQHRPAADLLPQIEAFVAAGGVVKAADHQLIIRTRPDNLAELRDLIRQLDRPLRRLLITVRQVSGERALDDEAALSSAPAAGEKPIVRVWRTDTRSELDREQHVQVIEGEQAFIDVGKLIPITDYTAAQSRQGGAVRQETRYAAASAGFYARPRLNGDTVTVDIAPYQTAATTGAAPQPAFSTQALQSTVAGKLGAWLDIGGSRSTAFTDDTTVITRSIQRSSDANRRIMIKVTELPH